MSYTHVTLDDSMDVETMSPEDFSPPTIPDGAIAPWLMPDDEPPTPPPKPSRSFGFPSKSSFSSFSSSRQPSVTNLLPIRNRPSESYSIQSSSSTLSIGSGTSVNTLLEPQHELRKAKSSMSVFSSLLRKTRSKPHLRGDSDGIAPLPPPLPVDTRVPFLPSSGPPSPPLPLRRRKKKNSHVPPEPPPKEPEFRLDTNLDEMDGIVDLTVLPQPPPDASSLSSGLESSGPSVSEHSFISAQRRISPPYSMFHNPNPFQSTPTAAKRRPYLHDHRKVSPKTHPPVFLVQQLPPELDDAQKPSWIAPESWAVEKEGEDAEEPEYTSSEDSGTGGGRPTSIDPTAYKRKSRRKTVSKHPKNAASEKNYKIRIYRAKGSYHIVTINLKCTVAELIPRLNQDLLVGPEQESPHRLYLKERGRERVLVNTERPADIVRRRLEQAGYDVADGLELQGLEDLTFLLKFVYKSQLLGPTEADLSINNFHDIDLTGRSLLTVPIIVHMHAEEVQSLKLSRNPMLDIPLDFLQSCTNLRELQLSNMAIKRVPQNVRHSRALRELDISCNRIADLDDAGLDRLDLRSLYIQNNRMEKLPWYFPRLWSLQTLNISNNKFRNLPDVIPKMQSLVELDFSFNMISELPDEIGSLKNLASLIIVGNQVTRFPDTCSELTSLSLLDCRRNHISDLSVVCMLPNLRTLRADHNAVHALDLSLGSCMTTLDASRNEITQLSLTPGPVGRSPYALVSLDISHAKLSSLDDLALSQLSSLEILKLDHNLFRQIPESLGELSQLDTLSCSDNQLDTLPASIGRLQKLRILDAHNNSLTELPNSLWKCASLTQINVTSNLIGVWHDPPLTTAVVPAASTTSDGSLSSASVAERKPSTTSFPDAPLALKLERLYLGENLLTDDAILPLTILGKLHVLNLSFNNIQDMPPTFFKHLTELEELYMSGNKLTSIPTEDLFRLKRLSVLFLNGNRLHTLPQELGKVQSLAVLDVGSNMLKYNINNWEFDWNWNFNKNLRYLNLSGNKKLQIRPDTNPRAHATYGHHSNDVVNRKFLSGFTELAQLRVLGLMDVTMLDRIDIPEENEDRRVRTSLSTVNGMAYGISDSLGKNEHLNMLDLVHEFGGKRPGEALFAMFGRAQPTANANSHLSKYLHDHFVGEFRSQLDALKPDRNEGPKDALRRSFLTLNKSLHNALYSTTSSSRKMSQASTSTVGTVSYELANVRTGASGIVLYFQGKTLYVANAGNALAIISRQGVAEALSRKHDPFDRSETSRIRAAEGWVSPEGKVNGEIDISRSFGFYHLVPVVNACPYISALELTESDEFVIIGNRGLWDYVSYQTAVDIARTERGEPMIAAQKLRDFAISYGAEGSTMIMVIAVADLFRPEKLPTHHKVVDMVVDPQSYESLTKRRKRDDIFDRNISRLDGEVEAPQGHLALVFTDIRNSTHLWEANPGMNTAMRLHNNLLRRQLRFCGGYEVKTEGDAFMCSFPTTLAAVWWCLTVQVQLLHESWPLEILECDDGKPIYDVDGKLIARGLSVRMGIHCGVPLCEKDPITSRMDYFGPMVNRAARINGSAAGGQIMCSADVVREINARVLRSEPETEFSEAQPAQAVDAIRRLGVAIVPVGEAKLKGLEVPEMLTALYPAGLAGRRELKEDAVDASASGSRVQFSVVQMRELGLLCLRLEALASARVFRARGERKGSLEPEEAEERLPRAVLYGDPNVLLPPMTEKASDADLMMLLDSLSVRIENALAALCQQRAPRMAADAVAALRGRGGLDERTLMEVLAVLQTV